MILEMKFNQFPVFKIKLTPSTIRKKYKKVLFLRKNSIFNQKFNFFRESYGTHTIVTRTDTDET